MSGLVRSDRAGAVATITLDSPANPNALSSRLLIELHAAFASAPSDTRVRVIVLTGAGPVFCSGADLKESGTSPAAAPELFPNVLQLIWDSPKPVVCRVNGSARAGGIGLIPPPALAAAAHPA